MAAPMSKETMSDPHNEELGEINPLSPHFNPLKALYSSAIALPFPEASVFDNLYQYEKVTGSREQARQRGVRDREDGGGGGTPGPGTASYGGQSQGPPRPVAREILQRDGSIQSSRSKRNEPVQLGTGFRATKDMLIDTQKYKPVIYRNALTRMSEYATGPLSVLYRCMNERCKVRVCTRSFKGLRSICTGYVVTFDKFFNMALVDVDETWRRPSTGQRFYHEEKLTFSKIMESATFNSKDSVKLMEFDNSKAQRSTDPRKMQRETAASTSNPQRGSSLPDRDKLLTLEKSGSTDGGAKPSSSHSRDGGHSDQNQSKDLRERRSKHTQEQSHRSSQEHKEEQIHKDSQKRSPKWLKKSSRKDSHMSRSCDTDSQKHIPKSSRDSSHDKSRESSRKGSQRSSCKSLQESGQKESKELRVKATHRKSHKDLQDRSSKHGVGKIEKTKKDRTHEKAKESKKALQDSLPRKVKTEKEADEGGSTEDEDDIESLQQRFAALQKELTTLSDDKEGEGEEGKEEGVGRGEPDIESLQKQFAALQKELTTLSDDEEKGEEGETKTDIESLQKHFAALQKDLTTLSDEEQEREGEEGKGATETEVKKEDLESVTDSQSIDTGQQTTTEQHRLKLAEGSNEVIDIKCREEHSSVVKCDITQHSKAVVHKETDLSECVEHTESKARTTERVRGGRLKIKPEDFRRRHVNQLFIRGDNVVLVSVDSNLLPR